MQPHRECVICRAEATAPLPSGSPSTRSSQVLKLREKGRGRAVYKADVTPAGLETPGVASSSHGLWLCLPPKQQLDRIAGREGCLPR